MRKSVRFRVFVNPDSASAQIAAEIAQLVRERATLGRRALLGLVAGMSPRPLYEELIYLHREEGLSFSNVVTFNVDEYAGLPLGHPASCRAVMQRILFDHIDIPPHHVNFLSSALPDEEIYAHCDSYDRKIARLGGIDYLVLGIGRNGQIGLNEAGTPPTARSRRATLDLATRQDAVRFFGDIENVPTHGLTMGCGTILKARRIALVAWGQAKSSAIRKAAKGPVTAKHTASYLQNHPLASLYLDATAASLLKRK